MRRLPEVLTWLAFVVLLAGAGCTKRIDTAASQRAEVDVRQDTRADVATVTHVVEGPGEVTTTVEDYGLGDAAPVVARRPPSRDAPATSPGFEPGQPRILLRRTVTVKRTGAVVTDTHQQAQASTETRAAAVVESKQESHTKTAPAMSCALPGTLWALAVLAAIAALLYLRSKL